MPMKKDSFSIYQLKDDPSTRYLRYESFDLVQRMGCKVEAKNYNLVYTAPLYPSMTLEGIFTKFNVDRPPDFTGHSLSVSDIVVISKNGEDKAYYVDNIGFQEIDGFLPFREPGKNTQSIPSNISVPIIRNILAENRLKDYLEFIPRFNRMTMINSLILFSQRPNAQQVATYEGWKAMGRQVRREEKSTHLLYLTKYQSQITKPKKDKKGNPVLDAEGNPVMEKVKKELVTYMPRYVFDISQTTGDTLPPPEPASIKCPNFEAALKMLRCIAQPYQIFIEPMPHLETNSYIDSKNRLISVRAGMSDAQTIKTALQQIANIQMEKLGAQATQPEIQCAAYVLANSMGLHECISFDLDRTAFSLSQKNDSQLFESFFHIKEVLKAPLYELERYQIQNLDEFKKMPPAPVPEMEQVEKLNHHITLDKTEQEVDR